MAAHESSVFDALNDMNDMPGHGVPRRFVRVLGKAGSTLLSKEEIHVMLASGEKDLYCAWKVLGAPESQAVLDREVFDALKEDFVSLYEQNSQLRADLDSLGPFQLLRKYKIWVSSKKWRKASTMHRLDVWNKSDQVVPPVNDVDIADQTLVGQAEVEEAQQAEAELILFVEDDMLYDGGDDEHQLGITPGPSEINS
ncbi:hypothetical protein OH77DRAFT_1587605 [Trametes cingulata]|nr:hypothetical protein OH77DRAFT_1587605 [Trametes cingulata]